MPYGRKRKRSFRRRRKTYKRSKRRYSSRFSKRRSALSKAFASKRRYRNRKLLALYRPGTLSFSNRYVKDYQDGWLTYRSPTTETIIAQATGSSPMELQFGRNYCLTPGIFNTVNANNEYTGMSENWEKYASKYQQGYVKYASVTAHFRTQDNRVFSEDAKITTSTLNPTSYIVGLMISRVPFTIAPLQPNFSWHEVKQLGQCVYKQYTAGASKSISVTAKVDVGKCLQQYALEERCFGVMPSTNIQSDPNTTYPIVVPNETRLWILPFMVPLTKSVTEGSAYTVNYEVQVRKLIRFSRPVADYNTIRQNVPTVFGQSLYPPIGTRLVESYRPMSILPQLPDSKDGEQDERLEVLEENDDEQDSKIQDNENTIQSLDQQIGIVTDDLAAHELLQFPNVH